MRIWENTFHTKSYLASYSSRNSGNFGLISALGILIDQIFYFFQYSCVKIYKSVTILKLLPQKCRKIGQNQAVYAFTFLIKIRDLVHLKKKKNIEMH